MKKEYYSNCLIEAIKAKAKNPKVKILYLPAFLNEVFCPHLMWSDGEYEYDFAFSGYLPWWRWLWHKGYVRKRHRGCYKGYINKMVECKYYKGSLQ